MAQCRKTRSDSQRYTEPRHPLSSLQASRVSFTYLASGVGASNHRYTRYRLMSPVFGTGKTILGLWNRCRRRAVQWQTYRKAERTYRNSAKPEVAEPKPGQPTTIPQDIVGTWRPHHCNSPGQSGKAGKLHAINTLVARTTRKGRVTRGDR